MVGNTVPQAFERLYFLERAAQAQVLALSTGRPLRAHSGGGDQDDGGAVRRLRNHRRPRSGGSALRCVEARARSRHFGLRELNSPVLHALVDPARAARSPIVFLLAAVLFINYVDRGTLPTAAHLMQGDLHLDHVQMGMLMSAFFWTYTCLANSGRLAR